MSFPRVVPCGRAVGSYSSSKELSLLAESPASVLELSWKSGQYQSLHLDLRDTEPGIRSHIPGKLALFVGEVYSGSQEIRENGAGFHRDVHKKISMNEASAGCDFEFWSWGRIWKKTLRHHFTNAPEKEAAAPSDNSLLRKSRAGEASVRKLQSMGSRNWMTWGAGARRLRWWTGGLACCDHGSQGRTLSSPARARLKASSQRQQSGIVGTWGFSSTEDGDDPDLLLAVALALVGLCNWAEEGKGDLACHGATMP